MVITQHFSYRQTAAKLGIPDASMVYRWVERMREERSGEGRVLDTKIDHDVPLPVRRPHQFFLEIAVQMKPGDSVYFDRPSDAHRLYNALTGQGFRAMSAKCGDGKRVWRIA